LSEKYYRYIRRTVEHIHRVQNNMVKVVTDFRDELKLSRKDCRILMFNVMNHDRSKFGVVQFEAYIELTEYYHQRKNLGNTEYQYPSEEIKKAVDLAVKDHYMVENHHPERFSGTIGKYDEYEAIETVCDLQAMAQEFNEGTCRKFYEEIWKPKQMKHFYDDFNWFSTIDLMDRTINCFENKI
jgi:hypothetical protein